MTIIDERKRYATVEVNDVRFTLDKNNPIPYETYLNGYDDIYECYEKPSRRKVGIWTGWREWFIANEGLCKITSYNCNFFTIEGFFTDKETGKRYFAQITYANHRLYEVEV